MNDGGSRAPGPAEKRADERDPDAVRAALAAAGPGLRRYLFGMGASWEDAEDAAQEAIARALEKLAEFDGRADVKTWLFTIARNHYLDLVRRRNVFERKQPMTAMHQARTPEIGPAGDASRAELAHAVDRALGTLPAEQREALALRESGGVSFEQAAAVLGVSPNTVKSRVRYALLKLAKELAPFAPEGAAAAEEKP